MSALVRTRGLLFVAAVLALPACSGGADGTPSTSVPTSKSTMSTTAAPDVSTIPSVIDEAYLNAVLAALDEVDGQATRVIKATKRFPPEAADLLNAIYSDEEFDKQANAWLQTLAEDRDLVGLLADPGSRKTKVERVIAASPSCVWIEVRRDYSQVATHATPGPLEYVALQPLDRSNDPQRHNPTAWMITIDGYRSDGKEPSNPCR